MAGRETGGCSVSGRLRQVTDDDTIRRQLGQLEEIERRAQELLDAPHYHMHDSKPVLDPATGEPLRDDGPLLRGMDAMLKATELIGDRKLSEPTWADLFDGLTPDRAEQLRDLYDALPDGARAEYDRRYGYPEA